MPFNIPPVNNVEMDRHMLVDVLEYLGYRIGERFSHTIRLVVHGGACMLMHPGLHNLAEQQAAMTPQMPIRRSTRDVDYIHRAFVSECMALGEPDGPTKLLTCIRETAVKFRLGADWMNSAADVALPMTTDPTGRQVDPIYTASIQRFNVNYHTIFSSANGMLRLISVAPFWAVSLKLVRYAKWDPSDICILLKYGTIVGGGTGWTKESLEQWLYSYCWSMGYSHYPPEKKAQLQGRIRHAIKMVTSWYAQTPSLEEFRRSTGFLTDPNRSQSEVAPSRESVMGTEGLDRNAGEWGGGDRTGWKASFAGDWVKPHQKSSQSPPHQLVYPPVLHSRHHSGSNGTSPLLPPLFTPQSSLPTSLDSLPRPRISNNVADWVAEKERNKWRESNTSRQGSRKEEETPIVPFVPPLPNSLESNHHSVDALGLSFGQQPPSRPEYHGRTYSQPTTASMPRPPRQNIYQTPPLPNPPTHVQRPPIHQTSPIHHSPSTHGPSPVLLYPQGYAVPYAVPSPPVVYHYVPPTKVSIEFVRRKKGKARDKAREKARSAKKWSQSHSIVPDGTYKVNLWHESVETESDDDDDGTPDTPQKQLSPTIYPLTNVVYYDQYQQQQQQQQQQQSSPHFSQQRSPPQITQQHQHPVLVQPAQIWSSPVTVNIPHMPTPPQPIAPTFMSPVPSLMPINSQPVIPPQEYTNHEKSSGSLRKLMSALKM
ncbi:hypothetical protein AN958_01752 [Leucoagaricus sp. SymC.cos]|nr:hypothetical protein AN958_01752 [Leucoagaricus sp. SymC.cos]